MVKIGDLSSGLRLIHPCLAGSVVCTHLRSVLSALRIWALGLAPRDDRYHRPLCPAAVGGRNSVCTDIIISKFFLMPVRGHGHGPAFVSVGTGSSIWRSCMRGCDRCGADSSIASTGRYHYPTDPMDVHHSGGCGHLYRLWRS